MRILLFLLSQLDIANMFCVQSFRCAFHMLP